ncbi:hypothetical protein CJF42_06025 [Pseudoalteromonas sp. NBT06-2]|uniref:DUF2589 domain-containing protein n=1 Tax=Pseudoalteromonas sp. NBT06-2 TaxID=2025950 RepID=UPI000BA70CBD|nr:DUF2589 domain-containing protein [Pseudoalteromonas sp. NBT06-2]PAJ75205.1 hypothetical protein CJF42_06025 [Pseudoalteromonas sp. NBT06-2]
MPTTSKILRALPMSKLISSPLTSTIQAQCDMSNSLIKYIHKMGFNKGKTRTIDFQLERPVTLDGMSTSTEKVDVSVPLLSFVPTPNLMINNVSIEFSLQVTEQKSDKSAKNINPKSALTQDQVTEEQVAEEGELMGRLVSHSEKNRQANSSANYSVSIQAVQQQQSEGWSKLQDLLCSVIEPKSSNY